MLSWKFVDTIFTVQLIFGTKMNITLGSNWKQDGPLIDAFYERRKFRFFTQLMPPFIVFSLFLLFLLLLTIFQICPEIRYFRGRIECRGFPGSVPSWLFIVTFSSFFIFGFKNINTKSIPLTENSANRLDL